MRFKCFGLLFAVTLMLFPRFAVAFQCPVDVTPEEQFKATDRSFLIYVTDTQIEEKLTEKLAQTYPAMEVEKEHMKFISAGYKVIEEFKGDENYTPRLIDILGIGTGYVGLVPGSYYLVMLPQQATNSNETEGMRHVDICSVPLGHYQLRNEKLQSELDKFRTIRDKLKAEK
ncbi:hypothetical protein ACFSJ3_03480 [Corallincola platygyrae]|uniref:Uncharacterized protein n=1 Tax=Corallincola platygyrae TaxID=1193278 RepID=A0ABW4XHL7_9GAMM